MTYEKLLYKKKIYVMINYEIVNSILSNENYTGRLFQGKKKINYRIDKKIKLDKENKIVIENHHEAIISKEDFDKV